MANSFRRTQGALRVDNGLGSALAVIAAFTLLAAWTAWALEAKVPRYEISDAARLEIDSSAYPVQANVAGMLIVSNMSLGKEVHAGDVLAELDSDEQRLSLEEQRTHLASLQPQIAALRSQMTSEAEGGSDDRRVLTFSSQAARAQYQAAETQAQLAAQEGDRASRLHTEGILSDADAQRAQAEAQSKREAAENLHMAMSRLGARAAGA